MARLPVWTRLPVWVGLAVLLAAGAAQGAADGPGDAAYGRGLAIDLCGECHNVARDILPEAEWPAPDLVERMRDPAMTELALRTYLQTSHPVMPNIRLSREQTDDLVAYLLTLKQPSR
ncbi:c-type cytochrome [Azospirillum halopraeferens]|uniref:c-type cytochrome n=1 Tax=Azospirillum halopraeferens TaxID=34010 RepID=UPI00040A2564|nr:hypothetical protein [Azospirillum halopraeferens]